MGIKVTFICDRCGTSREGTHKATEDAEAMPEDWGDVVDPRTLRPPMWSKSGHGAHQRSHLRICLCDACMELVVNTLMMANEAWKEQISAIFRLQTDVKARESYRNQITGGSS